MIETVLKRLLNSLRVRMQTLQPGADPLKELEWMEDLLSSAVRDCGADTSELEAAGIGGTNTSESKNMNRDRPAHYGLRSVIWDRAPGSEVLHTQIGPWRAEIVEMNSGKFNAHFGGPDPLPPSGEAFASLNIAKYEAIRKIAESIEMLEKIRDYV